MLPDDYFILAGGLGKRTWPLSAAKAKPAFPLNGAPLIAIMLERLRSCGLTRGFINVFHRPESILDATQHTEGHHIRYLYENELSGSRILSAAADEMGEWLLAMNGDIFFELNETWLARLMAAAAGDGIEQPEGALLLRPNPDPAYTEVLTTPDNRRFLGIRPHTGAPALMYAGVALLRRSFVAKIESINFFTDLQRLAPLIRTVVYDGLWLDIGSIPMYYRADRLYRRYLALPGDESGNSLSPGVRIETSASVRRSILWENTIIPNGAELDRCIVAGGLAVPAGQHQDTLFWNGPAGIRTEPF